MAHDAEATAASTTQRNPPWSTRAGSLLERRTIRYGAVALFFVAATTVWLSPIVRDFGGTMLGEPSDGSGSLREYWAAADQGESVFTWTHDMLATAPEGVPRSPTVAIANAVTPLFMQAFEPVLGLVAAWNLFLLVGFVLTGVITFLLLERLGLGGLPALFGAYVFAFNGFIVEKAIFGQSGFVHAWVFPLLLLALLRLRERRDLRSAVLAGLVVALAFYLQSYFGLLALLLVAVFMAVDSVFAKRGDRLWSFTLLDAVLFSALIAFAPVLVLWLSEHERVASVLSRPIDDLQQLGASLPAYVLPSGRHPLLGGLGEHSQQSTEGEPTLFFGYTTMALAAAAVIMLIAGRGPLGRVGSQQFVAVLATALIPTAFIFSLPREVTVLGIDVPTPSFFIGELVTYWRVYARFGLLVGLGLVLLAALALQAIAGTRGGRAIAVGALALVAFELSPGFDVRAWDASTPPPHVRWLADHPGGIVAYYPEPEESNASLYLMNREYAFQRLHGHPLYNMWGGGWPGTRVEALRILSRNPRDPNTAGILAAQHVRYAIALRGIDRGGASAPEFPSPAFEEVARLPDARIFEVKARPGDLTAVLDAERARVASAQALKVPSSSFVEGFHGAEPWVDGREWRWLRQNGRLEIDNTGSAVEFAFRFLAFSSRRPRTLALLDESGRVLGKAYVPTHEVKVVFADIRLPPGPSRLRLRAEPGPEQLDEERVASVFISPLTIEPLATYAER